MTTGRAGEEQNPSEHVTVSLIDITSSHISLCIQNIAYSHLDNTPATEIVYAACIVFGSKRNSSVVEASIGLIISRAEKLPEAGNVDTVHYRQNNAFDTLADDESAAFKLYQQDNTFDTLVDDDLYDFVDASLSKSPFKVHFQNQMTKANEAIETTNDTGENNYQSILRHSV